MPTWLKIECAPVKPQFQSIMGETFSTCWDINYSAISQSTYDRLESYEVKAGMLLVPTFIHEIL